MTQTYKDNLNRLIIAEHFNGNVQWGVKGSPNKRIESKYKFELRVARDGWELIKQQ